MTGSVAIVTRKPRHRPSDLHSVGAGLLGDRARCAKCSCADGSSVGCEVSGSRASDFELDLSRPEALITATLDRFGRIDALLNIAGAVPQVDLFQMTDEQWQAGMELKLHAARRSLYVLGTRSKLRTAPWYLCPEALR
jgi:NAD(P)-dependent dehydrogenase (short-subunit alcohol dehydrogenase family)